jgi:hypothetical protein
MKKAICFFTMLMLFTTGLSHGAGFFNLGEYDKAPCFFFSGAYYYGSRDIVLGDQTDEVYSLEYLDYEGIIGFAVSDSFAIYGAAAFSDFNLTNNINGDMDIKVSGGIRLKLFEIVKIALKAGESESRTFDVSFVSDFKISYFNGSGATVADSTATIVDWMEYQAALAAIIDIDPFTFYLGTKLSFINGTFDPAYSDESEFSNDGFFSILIGSSYDLSKGVRLQAEASIFAETSLGANLQFYF